MNARQKNDKKGFTIIEVVLVLAIAGLIFLMVFIALPALQRGQRDQQRKNDLSRAQTQVSGFQSNNRGAPPVSADDWNKLITNYLKAGGDTFADPSGTDYSFVVHDGSDLVGDFNSLQNNIYYTSGVTCGSDGSVVTGGARKVALRMKLEGGGVACVSN